MSRCGERRGRRRVRSEENKEREKERERDRTDREKRKTERERERERVRERRELTETTAVCSVCSVVRMFAECVPTIAIGLCMACRYKFMRCADEMRAGQLGDGSTTDIPRGNECDVHCTW